MLITAPFFDYAPEPITVEFQARSGSSSDAATYTFSGAAIGSANPRRSIIVGITAIGATPRTLNSVTVDGVSASMIFEQDYTGSGDFKCRFWGVKLPDTNTNTTGDIVITFSGSVTHAAINVWAVYNLQSLTPVDTAGDQGINVTSDLSVDVVASGAAFGLINGNLSGAATWTGLVEDSDGVIETVASSAAHEVFVASSAPFSITVNLTGTQTAQVAAAISLR
jgi:hypothetical protein